MPIAWLRKNPLYQRIVFPCFDRVYRSVETSTPAEASELYLATLDAARVTKGIHEIGRRSFFS